MLAEMIRELIKTDKNMLGTSEQVFDWAKRIETHTAQAVVLNSLSEVTDFDEICKRKATKGNETICSY